MFSFWSCQLFYFYFRLLLTIVLILLEGSLFKAATIFDLLLLVALLDLIGLTLL